ncbi:MAG: hypothetical protein FRX49_03944 [Trebouxia sp. A1-2]|nr:MAG: hypothetical protein FRX49_03944 [Trebouxia sp. A1-2]
MRHRPVLDHKPAKAAWVEMVTVGSAIAIGLDGRLGSWQSELLNMALTHAKASLVAMVTLDVMSGSLSVFRVGWTGAAVVLGGDTVQMGNGSSDAMLGAALFGDNRVSLSADVDGMLGAAFTPASGSTDGSEEVQHPTLLLEDADHFPGGMWQDWSNASISREPVANCQVPSGI